MNNDFSFDHKEPTQNKLPMITWILLVIIWILCLLPFPFTGIIALIMNFAALVVTVAVLVKGYVWHGLLQLLSELLLTPAFYAIGILISASLIAHTLNTDNLSIQSIQRAIITGINDEIGDVYKLIGKEQKSENIVQEALKNIKPEIPFITPKQDTKKEEQIITWYVVFTKDGGKMNCSDVNSKNNKLTLKTKSGLEIEIPKANIEKIERYMREGKQTKKSIWNPRSMSEK